MRRKWKKQKGTNFIDYDELKGRTVAEVFTTPDQIGILFTDKTYTAIGIHPGYYAEEDEVVFEEPEEYLLKKLTTN